MRAALCTHCPRGHPRKFQFVEQLHRTIEPVILSERQRVEESTHFGNCRANIWCEDPSTTFHSVQDDKTGKCAGSSNLLNDHKNNGDTRYVYRRVFLSIR